MRILLVRPPAPPETIGLQHIMVCEPLELEYLAAVVPDHTVQILDLILEKRSFQTLVHDFQPDLVGFTGYITHVNLIKELARQIKHWCGPGTITVVGGVHAEVVPEDFLCPDLDYIVCANGLASFAEIVAAATTQRPVAATTGIYHQGQPKPKKIKALKPPHPKRELVARYRSRYYYLFHRPCALIKTSYGCPAHCSFCFCREITDHAYYVRPLDDVMDELATIAEPEIYIVDDNFLVSRKRVLAFCDALERRGIHKRFLIYGRADFIAGNSDVIQRFASLGLRAVIVGLESCRPEDLQRYQKHSPPETGEQAVRILHQYGVDCYATLILGNDWGKEEFRDLKRWLVQLGLIFINLQPLTPLPGTEMAASFADALRIPRSVHEKWDLAHLILTPEHLSVAAYYGQIIKLYYGVTFRPRALWMLLRRWSLKENLHLSVGSSRVTWQYLKKMLRNLVHPR